MNTLNFDKDYNHKFSLDYFTTIRTWTTCFEKDIYPNTAIEVTLDREYRGFAAIISVTPIDLRVPFEELSPILATALSMDIGLPPKDAYEEVKQKIGTQVALILLGW